MEKDDHTQWPKVEQAKKPSSIMSSCPFSYPITRYTTTSITTKGIFFSFSSLFCAAPCYWNCGAPKANNFSYTKPPGKSSLTLFPLGRVFLLLVLMVFFEVASFFCCCCSCCWWCCCWSCSGCCCNWYCTSTILHFLQLLLRLSLLLRLQNLLLLLRLQNFWWCCRSDQCCCPRPYCRCCHCCQYCCSR